MGRISAGWRALVIGGLLLTVAACGGGDKESSGASGIGQASGDVGPAAAGTTAAPPAGAAVAPSADVPRRVATALAAASQAAAQANAAPRRGNCEITITGDLSLKQGGIGGRTASDRWMNESEIRENLRRVARLIDDKKSAAEIERQVDQDIKEDPALWLLSVGCNGGGVVIELTPHGSATYADVPMAAKKYPIPAGSIIGGARAAGEWNVVTTVNDIDYYPLETGELNITRFDASGIAGTFRYAAEEFQIQSAGAKKRVVVAGTFDIPCSDGGKCRR